MARGYRNLQVLLGEVAPGAERDRLISVVRDLALTEEYEEVADWQQADRGLAIGPAGRWVAVYDSACSGEAPRQALPLLPALSLHFPVVSVAHWETMWGPELVLYLNGEEADRLDTNDFLWKSVWNEGVDPRRRFGHVSSWAPVLTSGDDISSLEDVWRRVREGSLREIADLLGWSCWFSGYAVDNEQGYDHYSWDLENYAGLYMGRDEDASRFTSLSLRQKDGLGQALAEWIYPNE